LLNTTWLASTKGPAFPKRASHTLYSVICEVVYNLVAFNRSKIRGRHHLLVGLYQTLLNGLFVADPKSNLEQPPWQPQPPQYYGVAQASAYARLLSALCSPISSSTLTAGRKSRREGGYTSSRLAAPLIDEAKRARKHAGQFIHYVIARFCLNHLHGSVPLSLRAALMPATFEAIDVIPLGILRSMNAAMDPATREVWKSLYAEWRKGRGITMH
jgi:nucleolar pre-ribosomal-associated protein 2